MKIRKVNKKSIWYGIDNPIKFIKENLDYTYNWENEEKDKQQIIMTVGLPLFKSKKIIWLALESLKNQKEINFGWELIIFEEFDNSFDIIKSFVGKLPGCQRIVYRRLKYIEHLPLTTKWKTIAMYCSVTSKVFVFQDADDFSPTKRLFIHNEHFKNKGCYLSTQVKGIFYNITNMKTILYNGYLSNKQINHTCLNHAILIKDLKTMKDPKQYRLIHSFLFKNIKKIHKNDIKGKYIWTNEDVDKNNWKSGLFTDGCNSISISRKRFYINPSGNFEKNKYKLKKYFPPNVLNFLKKI